MITPVGTTVRDTHHCKYSTHHKQGLNLRRVCSCANDLIVILLLVFTLEMERGT